MRLLFIHSLAILLLPIHCVDNDTHWKVNQLVKVDGLESDAGKKINGELGEIINVFDNTTKRYNVRILHSSSTHRIKPKNLIFMKKITIFAEHHDHNKEFRSKLLNGQMDEYSDSIMFVEFPQQFVDNTFQFVDNISQFLNTTIIGYEDLEWYSMADLRRYFFLKVGKGQLQIRELLHIHKEMKQMQSFLPIDVGDTFVLGLCSENVLKSAMKQLSHLRDNESLSIFKQLSYKMHALARRFETTRLAIYVGFHKRVIDFTKHNTTSSYVAFCQQYPEYWTELIEKLLECVGPFNSDYINSRRNLEAIINIQKELSSNRNCVILIGAAHIDGILNNQRGIRNCFATLLTAQLLKAKIIEFPKQIQVIRKIN